MELLVRLLLKKKGDIVLYSLCFLFLLPVVGIFLVLAKSPFSETWALFQHLSEHVLFKYFLGSFKILAIAVPISLVLGTVLAFSIHNLQFFGKKFLTFSYVMCFATPAYLLGYVYINVIQDVFPQFYNVRNVWMCGAILGLNTFPYSFILVLSSLKQMPTNLLNAASLAGLSKAAMFTQVIFPLIKPSILAAAFVVSMDVLSDFGTVEYFAIDTLSTGVYRSWFAHESPANAALLSILMSCITVVLVVSHQKTRTKRENIFSVEAKSDSSNAKNLGQPKLSPVISGVFFFLGFIPSVAGFLFPLIYLVYLSSVGIHLNFTNWPSSSFNIFWTNVRVEHFQELWTAFYGTTITSTFAAVIVLCITVGYTFFSKNFSNQYLSRKLQVGIAFTYALPGSVCALSFLPFQSYVQKFFSTWQAPVLSSYTALATTFTIIIILAIRYCYPFFSGYSTAFSHLTETNRNQAEILGASKLRAYYHGSFLPLFPTVLGCFLLCVLEVAKEIPIISALRPFGLQTLAIKAYLYASDELLGQAAPYLLIILCLGALVTYIVNFVLPTSSKLNKRQYEGNKKLKDETKCL